MRGDLNESGEHEELAMNDGPNESPQPKPPKGDDDVLREEDVRPADRLDEGDLSETDEKLPGE